MPKERSRKFPGILIGFMESRDQAEWEARTISRYTWPLEAFLIGTTLMALFYSRPFGAHNKLCTPDKIPLRVPVLVLVFL